MPLVAQQLRTAMCVHRIPLPTSVTIASRPSYGNETVRTINLIWVCGEAESFCKADWTGFRERGFFCPSGKSLGRFSLAFSLGRFRCLARHTPKADPEKSV
jgi:hypothetical protein